MRTEMMQARHCEGQSANEIQTPQMQGQPRRNVVPAKAGTHGRHMHGLRFWLAWIPAFAGMTAVLVFTAHPAVAYEAYVSNEKSNTVSVIDTDKLEVVKTIKVGQRPRGIAVTRDGKSVIVAVGDDDTIQIVDTKTKEVAGNLPSGPDPEFFAFGPGGKHLYVANENNNTVTIVDTATQRQDGDIQVGVEPEGMAISPDGKFVVCTSETSNHGSLHRCKDP